jgi:carbon monoxide dehydrogenase subunit G
MNLQGSYRVKAPQDRVWAALSSPEMLRHCTPGCKHLVVAAEGVYDTALEIGIGSIKGRFSGKIEIRDQVPGSQYKLTVSASGSAGFLNAQGVVDLKDAGAETLIEYSGQAQVGGPIAGVGQRMVDGVAKRLVAQFFACFAKALEADQSRPSGPDPFDKAQGHGEQGPNHDGPSGPKGDREGADISGDYRKGGE